LTALADDLIRRQVTVIAATGTPAAPLPLLGDRLVHASPHLLFDHLELRPHAVPPGLPFDLELASLWCAEQQRWRHRTRLQEPR
jgi:hypothetical protein